ncbi:hypothetical protein G7Y89_g8733 [Cudoniella acicularis]|uniref:Xylanolytic transcriptional activator regulatory domain-containing protein n=1 Tax=Cudoniella acicularis TaxID=354080 RepID=A0A8H4RG32_9HELO|nr:hypothetical protein G7Y89_g8733 [Cudoniella acicularis]
MSPAASEQSPADPTAPPNKRRKTQLACHPCRARKTGCDGRRPCCDTAIKEIGLRVDSAPVYGASSNSSFVQQVASVVGSGYEHVDKTGIGIGCSISRHSTADYNVKDLVLPPRQLADSLLQCYWELFHPVYPVLHRPTFHAAYSQLWQPIEVSGLATHNKTQDVVFYSTLNIVLALGCQRNEALAETEREDLASEFYKRRPERQQLPTNLAGRCVGEWHICVLLDWMTSLSFDRPRALSKDTAVPLPELIDDEYLSETNEGQQPQNVPSCLAFFAYAMKLLDIRAKFLIDETQYLNIGRRKYSGQKLGATLDLISDLDRFLEALPPHLRTDHTFAFPESGNETCFKLQARILKARVMYARLCILRPFIAAEANRCVSATTSDQDLSKSTLNVQNTLYKDLCTLCVSTAHDALKTLDRQLSSVYRSSPWHSLYFTFAAASVLVAATLCPYLGLQFDQNPCKASWDRALHIFAFHKAHVASAEKGIKALEIFRNYISTRGVTTQTAGALFSSNIENTPAGGSSSLATSMAFDSNSGAQILPEISEFNDPLQMDESWFVSQDFYFDDGIIQWQ